MSHTREPWHLGEYELDPGERGFDGTLFVPPTEDEIAEAEAGGYDPSPYIVAQRVHRADAERIVACVNACAKIDTQALEALKPGDLAEVWPDGERLRRQRDELLAAAEAMLDVYDLLTDNGYAYNRAIVFGRDVVTALRAAVARAKGVQP